MGPASMRGRATRERPQVRACVSDSAYSDFLRTAENVVESGSLGTPPAAPHPLVDLARARLRRAPGGYDLALARPADALARTRVPVLLVHGEKAHSLYFSEDTCKKLKGDNKELLIVPGASHTDLYDNFDKIPFDRIELFFREYLK